MAFSFNPPRESQTLHTGWLCPGRVPRIRMAPDSAPLPTACPPLATLHPPNTTHHPSPSKRHPPPTKHHSPNVTHKMPLATPVSPVVISSTFKTFNSATSYLPIVWPLSMWSWPVLSLIELEIQLCAYWFRCVYTVLMNVFWVRKWHIRAFFFQMFLLFILLWLNLFLSY